MQAKNIFRQSESFASIGKEYAVNISNKSKKKGISKKITSFGAMGFLTIIILFFAIIFGTGNLIPTTISDRLVEETDMQYADAVESKKLVFQQALYNGNIPKNTADILESNGVHVGYLNTANEFIPSNSADVPLVLKTDNQIITADDFIDEVSSNINLYNAFNNATYSRAAYYYDDAAMDVFKEIGTNRNNYTSDSDFNDVMSEKIDNHSINISETNRYQKNRRNSETGEIETYYEYETSNTINNSNTDTSNYLENIANNNFGSSSEEATISAAQSLSVADTISKEQRSSLFFVTFMENISKMKAGDGSESKINESMNYLFENSENEIVNVKNGNIIKVSGSAMDSPSLYAILSGNQVNSDAVNNYASDRIIKTINNQYEENSGEDNDLIMASVATNKNASISKMMNYKISTASAETLNTVSQTVSSSLINNSFSNIKGINAGEFLVEGAINLGKRLAKASGGTMGDENSVSQYIKLNSDILAMDASVDRMNRSPFDITSKNTFLGSIIYNFALSIHNYNNKSILNGIKVFSVSTNRSILSLLPSSFADSAQGYLNNTGDCETYRKIGAVGSVQCSEIITFDTSTLNDPFYDSGFISFVENNTTLNESGVRTINDNSKLAEFILYNNERITPNGIMDGGIINSLSNKESSIPYVSDLASSFSNYYSFVTEEDKNIASGAAFVNSSSNLEWNEYKYAQRYVSLARATEALRKYSDDDTAYTNIKYFEGNNNPVIAFLKENAKLAKYSQH